MASYATLEMCCRLGKDYNAAIVTQIFQTTNMSEGACRAISSSWIGANLPETFTWKTSISEQLEIGHEAFVKIQQVQAKTLTASTGLDVLLQESRDLVRREETIANRSAVSLPQRQRKRLDEIELEEEARELEEKLSVAYAEYQSLLGSGGTRRIAQHQVNSGAKFNATADIRHRFSCNGFYYFTLQAATAEGSGHALAFYYQDVGECRFLDANTGEWALEGATALRYFFSDYMATVYKGKYDGRDTEMIGFLASLSDRKHHSADPCPFSTCPVTGPVFSCTYATRGISRIRAL